MPESCHLGQFRRSAIESCQNAPMPRGQTNKESVSHLPIPAEVPAERPQNLRNIAVRRPAVMIGIPRSLSG